MSEELSCEAARVLCRVPEIPIQNQTRRRLGWSEGLPNVYCDESIDDLNYTYRLKPSAPLTPQQAAIVLAMGCKVEMYIEAMFDLETQESSYDWYQITKPETMSCEVKKYRVPPEQEEA